MRSAASDLSAASPTTPPSTCPRCGAANQEFLRNGTRRRRLLQVVDAVVVETIGVLTRWKCPSCRRAFTVYPECMLPFKHFDRPTIVAMCRAYLENPATTYRACVFEGGLPIAYPDPDPLGRAGDEEELPALLSHTAVYRWVRSLASQSPVGHLPPEELSGHPRVGNKNNRNPS